MMNNMVLTFEQVDGKLLMTIELVKLEHPNPTMIRSNDGNTETIEFVNPPLNINTNQGGLDLSKYKPFPEGYGMKKGTWVVMIYKEHQVPYGTFGVVMENSSISYIDWERGLYRCNDESALKINGGLPSLSEFLAPLDPSDHPDYKDEQTEARPMNADEIGEWAFNNAKHEEFYFDKLIQHINALVQYELNKAKR